MGDCEQETNANNKSDKLDVPQLLIKLNQMYDKEDELKIQIKKLMIEYQQLQEDKEILQMMIMHRSNKNLRYNNLKSGI